MGSADVRRIRRLANARLRILQNCVVSFRCVEGAALVEGVQADEGRVAVAVAGSGMLVNKSPKVCFTTSSFTLI